MVFKRNRIVIVGANFAGLTAAMKLPKTWDVTVIDPSPHFEWVPGIHEILSGVKTAQGLRLDRAKIIALAGHQFLEGRVTQIDARARRMTTAEGKTLAYDAAILALGGVINDFHIAGVDQHTWPFRSVEDSLAIERRLEALLRDKMAIQVVIVGGGLSGVEALGELLRRYRSRSEVSFSIVEAGDQLMPGFPGKIDLELRQLCETCGVAVYTGDPVSRITPKGVWLASGKRLPSMLTLWTAGLAAPPLLRESRLIRPPHRWAPVHQNLQSRYSKAIFVVGDAAALPKAVSKQASNAIEMGALAAQNAVSFLSDKSLKNFKPPVTPILVSFGDLQTYLIVNKTVIASKTLAGAKEGVYQVFMAQTAPQSGFQALPKVLDRLRRSWQKLMVPSLL